VHKVKAPFLCRANQFREGERDLCIGIQVNALKNNKVHRIQVGSKVFDVDTKKAFDLAVEKNSFFNKDVAIVPYLLVSEEVKDNE
jgi:hypothetical protein